MSEWTNSCHTLKMHSPLQFSTTPSGRIERLGRRTPQAAFSARTKARPGGKPFKVPPHCLVRQDKVHSGNITLRHKSTLYHVAVGRWQYKRVVLILVANRDIRIMNPDGTPDSTSHLGPQTDLPATRNLTKGLPASVMSRDTSCRRTDWQLRSTPLVMDSAIGRDPAFAPRSRSRRLPTASRESVSGPGYLQRCEPGSSKTTWGRNLYNSPSASLISEM